MAITPVEVHRRQRKRDRLLAVRAAAPDVTKPLAPALDGLASLPGQQVVVNKGSTSGVFLGQPVLDANAVMGQVIEVNPLTATVLLITDASHSLPVQVNRNGLRSIAEGTGLVNRLEVSHLPHNADIREGDLLVTSGLGGHFPPGYPVARVTEVKREPGKPFATVVATPTARLDRSREMLLVWTLPPPGPKDYRGASAEAKVAP